LPSPPGSTPGLSFSSWTCCWSLVLLLLGLVLSFNPSSWFCWRFLCDAVQELVLFLVLCARTVVFLWWLSAGRVSAASSGWCSSGQLLALLAAVVLPAPASSSVTKLLVSCVPVSSLSLVSSTPGRAVQLLCTLVLCTPSDLKEQMLHLVIKLNDAMAIQLPKSESKTLLTLIHLLLFIDFVLCRLQTKKNLKMDFMKISIDSLDLGFYSFNYLL
jgi:hypothetical protein